jgi:death-on-curing protein
MSEPIFLTLDEVIELHHDAIAEFGGTHELRDPALLQSAVEMPRAAFAGQFLHPDLPTMAAALLFHLVQNHPFVDGNKRVGAAAARVFLLMNDVKFNPPPDDYAELVLGVARGEVTKPQIAEYIRKHIRE